MLARPGCRGCAGPRRRVVLNVARVVRAGLSGGSSVSSSRYSSPSTAERALGVAGQIAAAGRACTRCRSRSVTASGTVVAVAGEGERRRRPRHRLGERRRGRSRRASTFARRRSTGRVAVTRGAGSPGGGRRARAVLAGCPAWVARRSPRRCRPCPRTLAGALVRRRRRSRRRASRCPRGRRRRGRCPTPSMTGVRRRCRRTPAKLLAAKSVIPRTVGLTGYGGAAVAGRPRRVAEHGRTARDSSVHARPAPSPRGARRSCRASPPRSPCSDPPRDVDGRGGAVAQLDELVG